ncbi:hypothetical protein JCM11641_005718 [Rhodosporidiobolus odoratus]
MFTSAAQAFKPYSPRLGSATSAGQVDVELDPHDLLWFDPSSVPSAHLAHTAFSAAPTSDLGGPMDGRSDLLSYGLDQASGQYDGTGRRYSDGDQAFFAGDVRNEGQSYFPQASEYGTSGAFFESSYTLAPASSTASTPTSYSNAAPRSSDSQASYSSSLAPTYPIAAENTSREAGRTNSTNPCPPCFAHGQEATVAYTTSWTLQQASQGGTAIYPADTLPPSAPSTFLEPSHVYSSVASHDQPVPFVNEYSYTSYEPVPAITACEQPATVTSDHGPSFTHTRAVTEAALVLDVSYEFLSSDGQEPGHGRHHSFSGPYPASGELSGKSSRRRSLQAASASEGMTFTYSPYPSPSSRSGARRKSSQISLAGPAASSANYDRRTSTASSLSGTSFAPALSPGLLPFPSSAATQQPPLTPSRRGSSFIDAPATFSVASGPELPSPSPVARRNSRGLTVNVDFASSAKFARPRSSAGSPLATSPYSPYSLSGSQSQSRRQSLAAAPPHQFSPTAGSPTVNRKRRYSADPYLSSLAASSSSHSSGMDGSSLVNYAGQGPPAGTFAAMVEEEAQLARSHTATEAQAYGPPHLASFAHYPQTQGSTSNEQYPAMQVPSEGKLGLGLEMNVEEMHLSATAAATAAGIVTPTPFSAPHAQSAALSSLSSIPPSVTSTASCPPYPQQTRHDFSSCSGAHATAYESPIDAEEQPRRLDAEIREYLRSENKLSLGEKTVVIMNPRTAQRSYGTEKRLLAPPPMSLLLGSSWWTTLDGHPSLIAAVAKSGKPPSPPSPVSRMTLPPDVFMSISTAKNPLENSCPMSWMSEEGKVIVEREESDAPPLSGRAVSKGLSVKLPGELNKDVTTTVTAVVSIAEPGVGEAKSRIWATVQGKPINVISKPSKKRNVTAGSSAGLTHGCLVSLYNRTRTFVGSTRYLCTSGVESMFPIPDWHNAAGPDARRAFTPTDIRDVRFTTRMNTWDAFIIYAVDINAPPGRPPPPPPHPSYPVPPAATIPLDPERPKTLYYNQTVVLQDLATGVISPVLIIRRAEPKAIAVGGASLEGFSPCASEAKGIPVAPGEMLSEAVSQYRPIALEVFQDVSKHRSDNVLERPLPEDSYLGVVDDEVGVHQAPQTRTHLKPPGEAASQPITPTTPGSFAVMQQQYALPPLPYTFLPDSGVFVDDEESQAKRPRRMSTASSSSAHSANSAYVPPQRPTSTLARSRRRGQSMTSLAQLGGGLSVGMRGKSTAPKAWTIPVGDHCIWSIVAVDVERHTFFVPPSVASGRPVSLNPSPMINPLYSVPRPLAPIGPNIPVIYEINLSFTSRKLDEQGMIAINGDHFSRDLTIWIGDSPLPTAAIHKSPQTILIHPPPLSFYSCILSRYMYGTSARADGPSVALVRDDGVVFLSPFTIPAPVREPTTTTLGGREGKEGPAIDGSV